MIFDPEVLYKGMQVFVELLAGRKDMGFERIVKVCKFAVLSGIVGVQIFPN